ncbi:MAG: thymidine phosphorylase, partial [Candidatus Aminicenantes bacterium]|nr:thymidine phosphorylase [Candidatus Aminicenantes bacterium]
GVLAETGMVICGQTDDIVPADKKLYALRDATATVSSIPLIASSIMSKKLALGSDGIVLDVKTGAGAFMREERDSIRLCRTMVGLGEKSGRRTLGIISAMEQPLGRAVGNSLEIREALEALKGRGPADLMEVTYALGWCMLRAAGESLEYARAVARFDEAIASGRALEVFRRFVAAQGGDARACEDDALLPAARIREDLPAPETGWIAAIDSFEVGMAAIDTGAGRRRKEDAVSHGAGFVFHAKVGDKVEKGERLLTIHSDRPELLPAVHQRLAAAIRVGPRPVDRPRMVLHLVDKDGVHPWPH